MCIKKCSRVNFRFEIIKDKEIERKDKTNSTKISCWMLYKSCYIRLKVKKILIYKTLNLSSTKIQTAMKTDYLILY